MVKEAEHPSSTHMHKREFWILTNKPGNNVRHENEAEGPWPLTFVGQNPKFFLCMC